MKRWELNGMGIDSPYAFEDAKAEAGRGEAAISGGECSSRESPSANDVL